MNILFVLDHGKTSGGGYYQGLNYLDVITSEISKNISAKYYFLQNFDVTDKFLNERGIIRIQANFLNERSLVVNTLLKIFPIRFVNWASKHLKVSLEEKIQKLKIDLVIFLGPSRFVSMIGDTNYVASSWDLSHREDLEFKEVRDAETYFQREFWIKNYYPRSIFIVVDSNESKSQLISWYNIDASRICVMPFSPNIELRRRADLDCCNSNTNDGYHLILPAQFWSHKGHLPAIRAVHRLVNDGYRLQLSLVGGARSAHYDTVRDEISKLGLSDVVRVHGFVSDEKLHELYSKCDCVLFPSYFGPTNLPPLEAVYYGKPAVLAGKKSFFDFYGDEFFYFDLLEEKSLDAAIIDALESGPVSYKKFLRALNLLSETGLQDFIEKLVCFQRKSEYWR